MLANGILPYWVGVMVFIGVLGASMSTANGAMLVMSVVTARNLFERYRETPVSDGQMLTLSRLMAIPTAMVACLMAWWKPEPGILLVIAFDIVFAGCVVPLFYGVHSKAARAEAAVAAIVIGTSCRLVAHFVTPAEWAGLDTMVPPLMSWLAFVVTMKFGRTADVTEAVAAHGD
jgi:Na+/pantothenate symporter